MKVIRYLSFGALAALATATLAQAPFQVSGLHPDLVFVEAVAGIEKLGGTCRVKHSRTEGGGISAQCEIPAASKPGSVVAGEPPPGPEIALQPITRIGVEAPIESAQLTRIVFVFEGELEKVAEHLERQYGKPDQDGTSAPAESWSHAKRRSWSEGNYTLGLSNSPDLVILTVIRPTPDPGAS